MIDKSKAFSGKDGFYFVSIGGSDEIGMNCLLYICNEKILIVDMGIGFPDNLPGVQVIVPDLSYLFWMKESIVGLVITHIHEDHCGALPYLLRYLPDLKIYGTKFCLNFVQAKLDESGCKEKAKMIEIRDEQILKLGQDEGDENSGFEVEFVHLTHSTPEVMAIYIKTKYGSIFHTSDWKLDDDPVVGAPINRKRLKQIGEKGITAMICDSTNAMVQGHSKSEGSIKDEFERIISQAKNRVIVTLFASNVGRISTILSIAQKLNKKVCLVGRAVGRVVNAAKESGFLDKFPSELMINEVEAHHYKPEETIILCTGCQAEPLAALTKIVNGRHRHLKFYQTDTVIFSSKMIPGNEKRIYNLYNQICRENVVLITSDTHPIHVSGHPAQEELKEMYSYIKPQVSIPVHGEDLHIAEHAKLAKAIGIPKVVVANNGEVVKIDGNHTSIIDEVKSGFFCVDGKLFRRDYDPVIKARKKIMENGVLVIFMNYIKKGKFDGNFETQIFAPGLLDEANDKSIMNDLIAKLNKELREVIQDKDRKDSLSYIAMNIAKKICKTRIGKDPIIKVNINFDSQLNNIIK
jgi:ribonuclease J